jgi:hypothetical protein
LSVKSRQVRQLFSRFNVLTVEGIGGNSLKSRYDKSRDASDEHLVEVSDNSEGNYIKDNDSMSIRYRSKYYSREYTLIEEETIFSDAELKVILPMRRMYGVADYKSNSSSLSSPSGLKDPTGTPVCYYIHNEDKPSLGYGLTSNNWLSQSFTTEL